jgi:Tol biopolymer transport system component
VNLRPARPARWLAAFALLASLITAMAGTYGIAEAAFPGQNGKIAFESNRDGNLEIYVMNADGSGQTRLTNDPANDDVPTWSPDGGKIAFESNRDGNYEIYVMNADGSGQTRLTNGPSQDRVPTWSPDGSKIAFSSDRDGNDEIYVMNADGSGQTRLTNDPTQDFLPAWSPVGGKIAFTSIRGSNQEIVAMNADGSGQTVLTNSAADDYGPDWSPDGSRISFYTFRGGNYEVYVMNADGTNQTNVTNDPATDGEPAWSPDGGKIVFDSTRDGNGEIYAMNANGTGQVNLTNNAAYDDDPDWQRLPAQGGGAGGKIAFTSYRDGDGEIYVMNADGSGQTNLTNDLAFDGRPAWSPDGTKIAFESDRAGSGNYEIYVMNADGSGVTRLTNNSANDVDPDWSPDGERIVFTSLRDGNSEIYVMDADGSDQTNLTNSGLSSESAPAWSPNGAKVAFERSNEIYVMNSDGSNPENLTNNAALDLYPAWSPDGSRIAFWSSRDGNEELYAMNADGSGQTRLTSNLAADQEPAWSPDGGRIAFTSGRDGNTEIYVMNANGSGQTNRTNNGASDSYPDWQPTGVQGLGKDLYDPNVRMADNFFPPDVGNQLIVADADAACAPNSALDQPSTIHVTRTTPFPGGPGGGGSASIPGAPQGGWAFGSITWSLDVTIGPQTNPAVASFWPLNDNGVPASAPMDSGGLNTGAIQSITGTFTIDPGNDGVGVIRGTVSGGPNAANWAVCRKFVNETTESPIQGGLVTGSFYMINAGVLTYHVRIGPPDFFGETGDATAYFMNSLSTAKDCPTCSPHDGARAGHFRMEFGTTVLGGGMSQTSDGGGPGAVTVEPIPDVTITFSDVTSSGATNVVKTTDAPSLPGGFHLAEGSFYEIFTTAGYTPPITVCFPTDGLSAPAILHYEGGAWVAVATTVVGDQACGQVNSLSPFAVGYTHIYDVSGPFQPVDPQPTVNTMKAGRTVPVKFKLGGDHGLHVFADGYPASQNTPCAGGASTDPVEATSSVNSGLSYDAATGTYQYNWKTLGDWKGQCRTLILRFSDDQELKANFKFN